MNMKSKKLNYLMKMMIFHLNHLLINSKLLKWMIATLYETPNFPLTYNEKREFMAGLILYDNTKENPKQHIFCVLTEVKNQISYIQS